MHRSPLTSVHATPGRSAAGDVTIRRARPADDAALATLAALDSARPLTGERLLAEVDGRPVAAVSGHDGRAVADPFVPTAAVVELLRLRVGQERGTVGLSLRARLLRVVPRPVSSAAA